MARTRHTTRSRGARTLAISVAAAGFFAGFCSGCNTVGPPAQDWDEAARTSTNAWAVRTAFENQIEAGIARRRTVYGHHFVPDTAALNPRGRREVEVIARHLSAYGIDELYFPRDGDGDELYAMRSDAIRRVASDAGLSPDELRIVDGVNVLDTMPAPEAGRRWALPSVDEPYDIHGGGGGSGLGGGDQ